jgi:alpha-beta hydrolase superfamily lysophospholipase
VLLVRILAPLLPHLALPTGLDDRLISRDPAVVAAYRADALVHGKATLGFGRDAIMAADAALASRLTYPSGSRAFAAAGGAERCTLIVYDGLYHEVHNEPERARVLEDVVAWLDRRIS